MKNPVVLLVVMILGLSFSSPVLADELDVTMEVVDENVDEEQFVREIELPSAASDQANESAAEGLDTANEVRESGREFSQDRAGETLERGRNVNVPD